MRKNLDNVLSEWLIVVGVAVCVIAALAIVASQQRDIWAQQKADVSHAQALQAELERKTGN
jgi:hypothetical protein